MMACANALRELRWSSGAGRPICWRHLRAERGYLCVLVVHALEKTKGFTARAGAEAVLCAPLWNIDDVHGTVTLAGNEQFVTAERHVHRLIANLDRRDRRLEMVDGDDVDDDVADNNRFSIAACASPSRFDARNIRDQSHGVTRDTHDLRRERGR
jgi:hypothetical protein